jgi:hypothetical protein
MAGGPVLTDRYIKDGYCPRDVFHVTEDSLSSFESTTILNYQMIHRKARR